MKSGCSTFILLVVFLMVALFTDGGDEGQPGENPRRPEVIVERVPPPAAPGEERPGPEPMRQPPPLWEIGIDDSAKPRDSQGTGFAIAPEGLWMTAEHVVHGCNRLGLATARDQATPFRRVLESTASDAALIADGMPAGGALPIGGRIPTTGDDGYHMGFPQGRPAVVHSSLMGEVKAVRKSGRNEPVLAWAEQGRMPEFSHALGGISGGPTLNEAGEVVGINSASSERRGRVLTTHPRSMAELIDASRLRPQPRPASPLSQPWMAAARFENLVRTGVIRPIYCDVFE